MPFYYNPGGGVDKINISNELGISSRQNNGEVWSRNDLVHTNFYKGNLLRNNDKYNIDNNTLDKGAGNTYFKVGGYDVGKHLQAKVIIFQAARNQNSITHNFAGGYHNNYNNNDINTYRFSNAAAWWVNISNVYNHVAFVVQGAGGGGGFSSTSNNNGLSGGGGGGGAMAMSGKRAIANDWGNRNFYVEVGAGGRSGTHHKYAGNDIAPEKGGDSIVYYYDFPVGNWNYYLLAGGGKGPSTNHNSGDGGNYGGTGAWGGGATGLSGSTGGTRAGHVVPGGTGGGHSVVNKNDDVKSYHTKLYNYLGGAGGENNQPGVPGGGINNVNVNWNLHGGPVTYNAPSQNNTAGGGGAGAAGNNNGNARPGKPGGPGADGYVAMFLYIS